MSASTERKLRQAARAAGTDKKMLAAQEAAKQKKKSQIRWTIGTIAVVLLIALIFFLDSLRILLPYIFTAIVLILLGSLFDLSHPLLVL